VAGPALGSFIRWALLGISSGERPFIDVLQDRRYWVTHLLTVPSLFAAGAFGVLSGLTAKAGSGGWAASFEILNNRF
jgi:hypothetical protein